MSNQKQGKKGEELAVDFLRNNRYRILARNYRSRFGEIDIIAKDKDTVCFVEVKSRSSGRFGLPQEALTITKQKKITQVAIGFLKEKKLLNTPARFDVVSVILADDKPHLELIKNAFELDGRFSI